jgi:hypothetical protein
MPKLDLFSDETNDMLWKALVERVYDSPEFKHYTDELRKIMLPKYTADLQRARAVAIKALIGYAREVSTKVEAEVRDIIDNSKAPNALELAARHIDAAREKP